MCTGESLTDRVRTSLDEHSPVREVAMFGGHAFMVNEKLVVSVGGDGDLLVRADPHRTDEVLGVEGARPAAMAGRSMGPSWIMVAAEAVATDDGLSFWLDVAIAYNETLGARGPGRRPRKT